MPTSAPFGLVTVTTAPSTGHVVGTVAGALAVDERAPHRLFGLGFLAVGRRRETGDEREPHRERDQEEGCPTDRHHDGPGHYSGMNSREVSTR